MIGTLILQMIIIFSEFANMGEQIYRVNAGEIPIIKAPIWELELLTMAATTI
jgi:hypothetical protein